MSETTETKALPTYRIYSVVNSEGKEAIWHELGAAWKHKDDKGFSLQFKALPLPGAQVVLRLPIETEETVKKGSRRMLGQYNDLAQTGGAE